MLGRELRSCDSIAIDLFTCLSWAKEKSKGGGGMERDDGINCQWGIYMDKNSLPKATDSTKQSGNKLENMAYGF